MMQVDTNPTNDKLTVVLDASAFSNSSCLLRLFNTTVIGYTSKGAYPNDVEFGSAFHRFRAHFREFGIEQLGHAVNKATQYFDNKVMVVKSNKKYLTREFLVKLCLEYADKYEKDNIVPIKASDGTTMLELKFAIPYYIDPLVEILLAGTVDEIAKIKNGIYIIADCKTTSSWDIEGFFMSYQVSSQLYFYRWILSKYVEHYPESIFAEICKDEVGVLIDGIFYSGGDKEVTYRRSSVMLLSQHSLIEFEHLIQAKVQELIVFIHMWLKDKVKPPRFGLLNGSCKGSFGLCQYAIACSANDTTTSEAILDASFTKRFYDPMKFGMD